MEPGCTAMNEDPSIDIIEDMALSYCLRAFSESTMIAD